MDSVVHFELPTKDLDRAKKFYSDIFGWDMVPMPQMNYIIVRTAKTDDQGMIQENGAINGGFTVDDPTAKGGVLVVNVDSIDDYLNKIKSSGCKVVMDKTKVGDNGIYARFEDPEGNIVGIWEDVNK